MSEIGQITGSFFYDWHGSRQATTEEIQYYLQKWPCVCARCLVCTVILEFENELGEEE